jgi:hypothetical protein
MPSAAARFSESALHQLELLREEAGDKEVG